ncbi:MAG TPA: hypothetical protein VLV83_06575 [Acidobacteriota bacterium]|nr:hypothetical protein [Acidobacteriota bacterium]
MDERRLFWAPMTPRGGDFQRRRALGMGLASVAGDLMSRYGLDFPTYGIRAGDYSTPAQFFLQAQGRPGWLGICGCYDDDLHELEFQIVDVASSHASEEEGFPGPGSGESHWTHPLALWLCHHAGGDPDRLEPPPEADPCDVGEMLTEAHAAGLQWLGGEVASPFEEEFVSALDEAFKHFDHQIGHASSESPLRLSLLWLAQEVGDYQRRLSRGDPDQQEEGPQEDVDSDVLRELRFNLDPAPFKPVWALLEKGIRAGADRWAFRACRGYVNLALGRPTASLEDFRLLRQRLPVQGHLALARAYERMEEPDQAVQEFSKAVALAGDDQPFSDIVAGRDQPIAENAAPLRAHLLFARGRCQWLFGRFGPAQQDLEQSVGEEGLRAASLEILAHLFRDWAIALDRRGVPQAAEKLRRHLEVLEKLYSLRPNVQDVEAALDAARRLGDSEALEKWRQREGRLLA